MQVATILLFVATLGFIGTHLLMSHALRARMVAAMGPDAFLAVYSLVSLIFFSGMLVAYHFAFRAPLLPPDPTITAIANAIASVLTLVALALLFGSIVGNPALVGVNTSGLSVVYPEGALKITRHPMMMAIAIWASAHMIMSPSPRSLIFHGGMIVLALVGSRMQDRKKAALTGRDWQMWMSRTSFWPDLRQFGALGLHWLSALFAWFGVTWLHLHFWGIPAGIWAFFPDAG